MEKRYNVAVVGATGAVGEAMLAILEERKFPVGEVYALASSQSVGKRLPFKGGSLVVQDLAEFDFSKAQIGLFSPGAAVSAARGQRRHTGAFGRVLARHRRLALGLQLSRPQFCEPGGREPAPAACR